jgi:hypothetical protein
MTFEPWRLRIRNDFDGQPGRVAGAGFVVTVNYALTCAHVVRGGKCWIEVPGTGQPPRLCRVDSLQPEGPGAATENDIAVITLPAAGSPAPLGSAAPPGSGTELEVVGFPEAYHSHRRYAGDLDRDERTRLRVSGPVSTGLIQADRVHGHPSLDRGYSGSATVDLRANRVVGMLAEDHKGVTDQINGRDIIPISRDRALTVGWVIPLAVIASKWSLLNGLLPSDIDADPDYDRARRELQRGDYGAALNSLNDIYQYYPLEVNVYYYRVLAALAGQRPGGYAGNLIEAMVKLLERAIQLDQSAAHVHALLSLVNEDYYTWRGIRSGCYSPLSPRQIAERTHPEHIRELVHHVPAFECQTWLYLRSML